MINTALLDRIRKRKDGVVEVPEGTHPQIRVAHERRAKNGPGAQLRKRRELTKNFLKRRNAAGTGGGGASVQTSGVTDLQPGVPDADQRHIRTVAIDRAEGRAAQGELMASSPGSEGVSGGDGRDGEVRQDTAGRAKQKPRGKRKRST